MVLFRRARRSERSMAAKITSGSIIKAKGLAETVVDCMKLPWVSVGLGHSTNKVPAQEDGAWRFVASASFRHACPSSSNQGQQIIENSLSMTVLYQMFFKYFLAYVKTRFRSFCWWPRPPIRRRSA